MKRHYALVVALACGASAALADEPKPGPEGAGGVRAVKPAAKPQDSKNDKDKSSAPMASGLAPRSGSMPTGPAPKGKLGTEPTARGKLGTEPQPTDPQSRPPRFTDRRD